MSAEVPWVVVLFITAVNHLYTVCAVFKLAYVSLRGYVSSRVHWDALQALRLPELVILLTAGGHRSQKWLQQRVARLV